ncbi:radical SAM protein [Clostridium cylindrosporum]|uniref:Radical SAM domain-containing protein n=1 Tax=Clostridium cylindrosporum DSM 605 TaxID=1121307 RepID=A0A0J8D454_CLOCY|nr:radical SAM protein [Clostridium cylindrosporum]KMT20960.1 radical SAM domain-containing protein [Clostridium cylindrosporum DSM 605]
MSYKEELKAKLYKDLELKCDLGSEGISFKNPDIFKNLDLGGEYLEQVHVLFDYNTDSHKAYDLPVAFYTPLGLDVQFRANKKSKYSIDYINGEFILFNNGEELFPLEFAKRPNYYSKKTSDGTDMRTVAIYNGHGVVFVAYSNECALRDKGKDCLFCNINATKDTYGENQCISWKYPRQIGETVAQAYREGSRHVTISGGFIPERREVDYYLDVAESIKEYTGLENFNGTACIGAPTDLSVIEKYKEAGFSTLAINIEVWNEHFFRAYCPGKEELCGGRDHWIKALEYAVKVFGRGKVRSNLVGGLEPKSDTLAGIEYLASKGVIALAPGWVPNPGSALEGHNSPNPEWHLDLAKKNAAILRKNGYTYEELYNAYAAPVTLVHDIYRIEDELLPIFSEIKEEVLV